MAVTSGLTLGGAGLRPRNVCSIYARSRVSVSVRGWERWTLYIALADTESTRVSGLFLPDGISGSEISFFQALAKSSLSLVVVFARIWKKLPLSIEQKLR